MCKYKNSQSSNIYSTTFIWQCIGVLEDSYALCMACKQNLSALIYLLAAYKEESEYTVLSRIIGVCMLFKFYSFSKNIICLPAIYIFVLRSCSMAGQISLKIVSMVADAAPELLSGIKEFFISLLQPFGL